MDTEPIVGTRYIASTATNPEGRLLATGRPRQ